MTLESMLWQTATVHHVTHGGAVDDYNKPIDVETTTTEQTFIQELSADEDAYLQDTGRKSLRAFFLPTVAIDMTDKVEVDGITYEVIGPPQREPNPRTRSYHHLEVYIAETV